MTTINFPGGILPASERIKNEKEFRREAAQRIIPFGVPFLDAACRGILPNDLVLVGAPTGAGKTEFVTNIALNAANLGKKVVVFALEAEEREIERRIKYKKLAYLYSEDHCREWALGTPNYLDWYLGRLDPLFEKYEAQVDSQISKMENFFTYYKDSGFTIESFKKIALAYCHDADLIVLDHLHYFDTTDDNENRGITDIVTELKRYTEKIGTPIVLVSHMRKSDRSNRVLVPSIDDFHGSSNVAKQANIAITIAPGGISKANVFETYIRVCKMRKNGSASKYISRCYFDTALGAYLPNFSVGTLSQDEKRFESITVMDREITPSWLT